jgi:hypothetical protein
MARYHLKVDYDGKTLTDDTTFLTLQEAQAHAALVAGELRYHNSKPIAVFVVGTDGNVITLKPPPGEI